MYCNHYIEKVVNKSMKRDDCRYRNLISDAFITVDQELGIPVAYWWTQEQINALRDWRIGVSSRIGDCGHVGFYTVGRVIRNHLTWRVVCLAAEWGWRTWGPVRLKVDLNFIEKKAKQMMCPESKELDVTGRGLFIWSLIDIWSP